MANEQSTEARASAAIEALKVLQKQLVTIRVEASSRDIYRERVDRWIKRAGKIIEKHISNIEAIRFLSKRPSFQFNLSPMEATAADERFWKGKLSALIDELKMSPQELFEESVTKVEIDEKQAEMDFFNIIHPTIVTASKKRLEDGHYSDAVFASFKAIERRVSDFLDYSASIQKSGKPAMMTAFSEENPIIKVGDLETTTGKDIQEGYKFIFAGSMLAIRNPKAHDEIVISSEQAIHLIFLASLQMFKLDEAGI